MSPATRTAPEASRPAAADELREWRWLAREIRPLWRIQALSLVALLLSTVLSLVDPLILKWLIDHGLAARRWEPIYGAVLVFCAVYALRIGLLGLSTLYSARVLNRLMLKIRLRLLRRMQGLDAFFFDRHPVGDLVHRVEQDVEQVGRMGVELLPGFVRIAVSTAATVVIMLALDWRLTLLVVPFVPAFLVLRAHFRRIFERVADATRAAVGARASLLTEALTGATQIQLLGAEAFFRRRYASKAGTAIRTGADQRRSEFLYLAWSIGLMTLVTASVLAAGAHRVLAGALTLGGFMAFYTYLMRLFEPLSAAVETYSALKRAGGSIRRIAALERFEPAIVETRTPIRMHPADATQLAFEDVGFAYADGGPVLQGASLHLRRGESVALLGRSGAGKTTLAKLAVRLVDPALGRVRVGEHPVNALRLRELRRLVAFVPSRPQLFDGTIRENVLLGRRGVPQAELERLARIVCFDRVVNQFPAGWSHHLSSGDGGLSDGERQRLGLLRALVRNPPVLIIDEGTGALDPAIEAEVLANLRGHLSDRVVLFITHRQAAAEWADRRIVLEDGRLWERVRPAGRGADPLRARRPIQLAGAEAAHE